jgi:Family of unknown function (DUF6502)
MKPNERLNIESSQTLRTAAFRISSTILRHLAFLCLRAGMSFGDIQEIARKEFCSAAQEHLINTNQRATTSRVAILTGLSRADVAKTLRRTTAPASKAHYRARIDRVIHGWKFDPRFTDADGTPNPLPRRGESSFERLCKTYSGDIPVRALLDELIERQIVEVMENGKVISLKATCDLPNQDAPFETTEAIEAIEIAFNSSISKSTSGFSRVIGATFPTSQVPSHVARICRQRIDRFLAALSNFIHTEAHATTSSEPSDISSIHFAILQDVRTGTLPQFDHEGMPRDSHDKLDDERTN